MNRLDYQIITTLGPASQSKTTWEAMLAAGATAFRLNTSHLSLSQFSEWMERLQPFLALHDPCPPVVLDLQGSKWRLGKFPPLTLTEGTRVELVMAADTALPGVLPVPHADFFRAAPLSSGEIVLNDAKVRLALVSSAADRVVAEVTLGGELTAHKGITFSASDYRSESLSEKDQAIVRQAADRPFVQYAISYLKDAVEMRRYRGFFPPGARLIAKLERRPALEDAASIAEAADELWLCRGDLGAELGFPQMAEAVAQFSAQAGRFLVPVMMAGQVLEHMTAHATPTRSEICYLYDTLQRGYRGFVLSDETAVGRFPVESVRAAASFRSGLPADHLT